MVKPAFFLFQDAATIATDRVERRVAHTFRGLECMRLLSKIFASPIAEAHTSRTARRMRDPPRERVCIIENRPAQRFPKRAGDYFEARWRHCPKVSRFRSASRTAISRVPHSWSMGGPETEMPFDINSA